MNTRLILLCLSMMFLVTTISAEEYGYISGRVISEHGVGLIYANLSVIADGQRITGSQTDISGSYRFRCPPGHFSLRISLVGYLSPDSIRISVVKGETTAVPTRTLMRQMTGIFDPWPTQDLRKYDIVMEATDPNGILIPNATFIISQGDTIERYCYSNEQGKGAKTRLAEGDYNIRVSAARYSTVLYHKVRIKAPGPILLSAKLNPLALGKEDKPINRKYRKPNSKAALSRLRGLYPPSTYP